MSQSAIYNIPLRGWTVFFDDDTNVFKISFLSAIKVTDYTVLSQCCCDHSFNRVISSTKPALELTVVA